MKTRTAEIAQGAPRSSILLHSFEVALGLLFPILGAGIMLGGVSIHDNPLPTWLVMLWGACLCVGGPLMLCGLLRQGRSSRARDVERAGLYLAGSAWLSLGVVAATLGGGFSLTAQGALVAFACFARAYTLGRVSRAAARIEATVQREAGSGL